MNQLRKGESFKDFLVRKSDEREKEETKHLTDDVDEKLTSMGREIQLGIAEDYEYHIEKANSKQVVLYLFDLKVRANRFDPHERRPAGAFFDAFPKCEICSRESEKGFEFHNFIDLGNILKNYICESCNNKKGKASRINKDNNKRGSEKPE